MSYFGYPFLLFVCISSTLMLVFLYGLVINIQLVWTN